MLLVKKIEVFLFMRGHNHFSSGQSRSDSVTEEYGQGIMNSAAQRLRSTRRLSRTANLWLFLFKLASVFTIVILGLEVVCSHLAYR
jgi:hypothetical protein